MRDLRYQLGEPLIDNVRRMPAVELDAISAEPSDGMPVVMHGEMLPALSPGLIEAVTREQTADSPLMVVEMRHLGGALRVGDEQLSPLNRTTAAFSFNALGPAFDPELRAAAQAKLDSLAVGIAPFADGSAYVNFMEGPGAEMGRAFAPAEWERLVALKATWDATNLFRFNRNIAPRAA